MGDHKSKKSDPNEVDEIEEVDSLEQQEDEGEKLLLQLAECETKYKRALADYQNLEKRVQSERREWIRSSNRDLILRLLPVLDTLELAQKHSQDQTLKVTYHQFLDLLKQEGVQKIQTEGKEFNPHSMECIATENGEEGKVLEELRPGYIMNEVVLRPAHVLVGKKKE